MWVCLFLGSCAAAAAYMIVLIQRNHAASAGPIPVVLSQLNPKVHQSKSEILNEGKLFLSRLSYTLPGPTPHGGAGSAKVVSATQSLGTVHLRPHREAML